MEKCKGMCEYSQTCRDYVDSCEAGNWNVCGHYPEGLKTGSVEKADNGLTLSAKIKDILNDFEHADDIVRNIFLIPDFQKECKACKAQYKTSLLDRVEADVETIFTLGFDSAEHCSVELCPLITRISEVKEAISKIRGEV